MAINSNNERENLKQNLVQDKKGGRGKRKLIIIFLELIVIIGVVLMYLEKKNLAEMRDANRIEDLRNIKLSLTVYYLDNKKYPESLEKLVPNYMLSIPKDPSEGNKIKGDKCARLLGSKTFSYLYKYTISEDNKKFTLSSCLESQDKLFLVNSYE